MTNLQLEFWGENTESEASIASGPQPDVDQTRDELQHVIGKENEPPPLVRPDRQIAYTALHHDWPRPDHDRNQISVDRLSDDIDGPAHRFTIQRHDYVEVSFSADKVDCGHVLGISHARQEVGVSFAQPPTRESIVWFPVGCIYPTLEPTPRKRKGKVMLSDALEGMNKHAAPPDGFTDADRVPAGSQVKDTVETTHQDAEQLICNQEKYAAVKRVELVFERSLQDRPALTSTQQARAFFAEYWKNFSALNDQEKFVVANLCTKHRVQSVVEVTRGTLDASLVHPREVFKSAIIEGSSAIVISHNHPSGDVTPSREDHKVTEQLTEAGKLLGITVLDHIIYGDGSEETTSIREAG